MSALSDYWDEALKRLEAIGKHVCSYDEREGGCPVCHDIANLENEIAHANYVAVSKEIEDAGLCQWGYVTDPYSLDRVVAEVKERRAKQDARWGGPTHDDTHTWGDWTGYVMDYNNAAANAISHDEFEDKMIDVAALAVAAIQSSRRKKYPR